MAKHKVKFCANFVQDAPLPELVRWWKAADDAGIDWLGVPDSPARLRELWVCFTAAALNTRRIPIISGVTNPIIRHPSVTAGALCSLYELAPGRVALGIGTADSAAYGVGLTAAKVDFLRNYIRAVKGLIRGEEVEWQGKRFKPEWKNWSPPKHIPIYVACGGPKVTKMAAQEADGIIGTMGYAPENIRHFKELIQEGCAEVGRDPAELDVWWAAVMIFGRSQQEVIEKVQMNTRQMTRFTLEGKQIPKEYRTALQKLSDQWNLKGHAAPRVDLVKMSKELGVFDWLMRRNARLLGTPEEIRERLAELAELGVTQWSLIAWGGEYNRLEWVDKLSKEVMPYFR